MLGFCGRTLLLSNFLLFNPPLVSMAVAFDASGGNFLISAQNPNKNQAYNKKISFLNYAPSKSRYANGRLALVGVSVMIPGFKIIQQTQSLFGHKHMLASNISLLPQTANLRDRNCHGITKMELTFQCTFLVQQKTK